jgi:hypothetical protein
MRTKQATHNHKRAGEVVLLESTAELGKVLVLASGDEFWVKLADLTQLGGGVIEKNKVGKKQLTDNRPIASSNNRNHVVRAA